MTEKERCVLAETFIGLGRNASCERLQFTDGGWHPREPGVPAISVSRIMELAKAGGPIPNVEMPPEVEREVTRIRDGRSK